MSTIKTLVNDSSVTDFINSIDDEVKKIDTFTLLELYEKATSETPKMWGTSMIGFGQYHYKSERSTQEGDWPLAAYSPRRQNLTLYLTLGTGGYDDLLSMLGKYKVSKACLYINKLSDIDLRVLEQLIQQSFDAAKSELGA